MDAALAEPEGEAPTAGPLAPRPGAGPARQTATGRVLRLVHGGSAPAAPPEPTKPTEAPAHAQEPRRAEQLGLFDPRPEAPHPWRPMEQLSRFDD